MADIICRCGEPWDSTGGIHHSHTDLPWWAHKQLLLGLGCPVCKGIFEITPERDEAWRSSIIRQNDGEEPQVDTPPYAASGQTWFSENPPPWCSVMDPALVDRLRSLNGAVTEPTEDDVHSEVWYTFPEEWVDKTGDLVQRANFRTIVDDTYRYGVGYVIRSGCYLDVQVATIRHGESKLDTVNPGKQRRTVLEWVEDIEASLAAYPVLDDEKLSELEHEIIENAVAEWFDRVAYGLSESTGLSEYLIEVLRPLLCSTETWIHELGVQPELAAGDKLAREPTDEDTIKFLMRFQSLAGWAVLATIEPDVFFVTPEVMLNVRDAHTPLPGFLVFRARARTEWVWQYPVSQLKPSTGTYGARYTQTFFEHPPLVYQENLIAAMKSGDYIENPPN